MTGNATCVLRSSVVYQVRFGAKADGWGNLVLAERALKLNRQALAVPRQLEVFPFPGLTSSPATSCHVAAANTSALSLRRAQ